MAGVRIGGVAIVVTCSPPWTAFGGAGAPSTDPQVFAACSVDAAGEATVYTDFSGFTDADQCHNPVLSPDGTKILFEVLGATSGFREVWVVDAVAGSTPTQLVADGSNYVIHPSWGADSDTFVYVHCASGLLAGGTIYKDTVSSPGSPTSLKAATGGFSPFRPQFNHDGTRVAYIWDQDVGSGSSELRCMDDDGTNDAALDNTLAGYTLNDPPQFGWANSQNLIAYTDGQVARNTYVIDDTGAGKTQLDSAGVAAGVATYVSAFPFAPDDSFVVITGNLGSGYISIIRAELDGSNTTDLSTTMGATNQSYYRTAIVHGGRIWFIRATAANGAASRVGSMLPDGSDETTNFDNTLGSGTEVADFTGGDGFYFN